MKQNWISFFLSLILFLSVQSACLFTKTNIWLAQFIVVKQQQIQRILEEQQQKRAEALAKKEKEKNKVNLWDKQVKDFTGSNNLPEAAVNAIRSLVANSVEGLKLDDVSVVDNHGKVLSEDLAKTNGIGLASSHIRMRENLENYFSKKIETMLHSVLGVGQVVARVSVDLETNTTTIVEEKYDPESQVIRTQTFQENSSSNNESNATQGPTAEREAVGGQAIESNSVETRKNKTISYDINKATREIVETPGNIKRMSAAVFIAQRTDPKNEKNYLSRSESELNSLKSMIANALGIEDLKYGSVVAAEPSEA